ncbi:PREDICTED: G-protein coupled receptor 26 [Nanorana parkeri]|uniref:G-protein coupled receptor 26 n=1 Tax=Nanorana parkeri TaxID=125878 RepID=UPI000854CA36|nr:PREDICTED: G-protein coupled receptor 26 [Nanorana parkeri]
MELWGIVGCSLVVLMIVAALLSNGVVLICFLSCSDIRGQVPGLFTLNLTLCNLLLTVINMPLTLVGVARGHHPGGEGLCRAVGFLETFLTSNSMLSMAALSIDRWVAVVFPLNYHSKMRYQDAALILLYCWIHSLSFPTVALCLSWVGFHQVYGSCTLYNKEPEERDSFMAFIVLFHLLSYLLSFLVLCVTYLQVLKVARSHCRRIDVITMQTLVLLVDLHPSVRQRCLEEQKRRRQRATKKIITFIGTFLLCFTPYVVTRLVEISSATTISPQWGIISRYLAYSKALSDPFVYCLLRNQYKSCCRDIVNKLLKRSSGNSSAGRVNSYVGHLVPATSE